MTPVLALEVFALENHFAVGLRSLGQQADQPASQCGLTAAGFADQAERLASGDIEAHRVDGPHRPAVRAIPDAQVTYRSDCGFAAHNSPAFRSSASAPRAGSVNGNSLRLRKVGFTVSLRPSPARVSPVINKTIARPGNTPVHHMPALAPARARCRSYPHSAASVG